MKHIATLLCGSLALVATDAAAQYTQNRADRCQRSFEQAMRVVCNAPVRRRVAGVYQNCIDEITQHRAECLDRAAASEARDLQRRGRSRD